MSVSAYEQALSQLIRCICVLSKNIKLPERFLLQREKQKEIPCKNKAKKL